MYNFVFLSFLDPKHFQLDISVLSTHCVVREISIGAENNGWDKMEFYLWAIL